MEKGTWQEILLRAQRTWSLSRIESRDTKLEVGKLLHSYLLERLREADTLTHTERIESRCTRQLAVIEAAKALSISRYWVNDLIRVSLVPLLLSNNGDMGHLSYGTIRSFCPLIEPKEGTKIRPGNEHTREEWVVREPVDLHRSLFQRAVTEQWTVDVVRKKVSESKPINRIVNKGSHVVGYTNMADSTITNNPVATLKSSISHATPKDAIDTLLPIIQASSDPIAVAERLLEIVRQSSRRITL